MIFPRFLASTGSVLVLSYSTAFASTITATFVAEVVNYESNGVSGSIGVGDEVTGRVTYTTEDAKLVTYSDGKSDGYSSYWVVGVPESAAVEVEIGGVTWTSNNEFWVSAYDNLEVEADEFGSDRIEDGFGAYAGDLDVIDLDGSIRPRLATDGRGDGSSISVDDPDYATDEIGFGVLVREAASNGTNPSMLTSSDLPSSPDDVDFESSGPPDFATGRIAGASGSGAESYVIDFEILEGGLTFGEIVQPDPIPEFKNKPIVSALTDPSGDFSFQYSASIQDRKIDLELVLAIEGGSKSSTFEFSSDLGSSYVDVWESGIEQIWNEAIDSVAVNGVEYEFGFDVVFLKGKDGSENRTIRVENDTASSGSCINALNWLIDVSCVNFGNATTILDLNEKHSLIAAHEFGHLLGLYDEYILRFPSDPSKDVVPVFLDPEVPLSFNCTSEFSTDIFPAGVVTAKFGDYCGSIMSDFGPPQARHYERLLTLIGVDPGLDLEFAMAPSTFFSFVDPDDNAVLGKSDPPVSQVPLPASGLVFGVGLLTLALVRRRLGN